MGIFSWFFFVLDDFRVTFHSLTGSARSISCSLIFFLICLSFCFLQDQYDIIEKHTQSGLELVEKYVKFVKERTEIEQNYAKQLRQASIISIIILLLFLRCLPQILNRGCLLLFTRLPVALWNVCAVSWWVWDRIELVCEEHTAAVCSLQPAHTLHPWWLPLCRPTSGGVLSLAGEERK